MSLLHRHRQAVKNNFVSCRKAAFFFAVRKIASALFAVKDQPTELQKQIPAVVAVRKIPAKLPMPFQTPSYNAYADFYQQVFLS
jgi:hypothetical protein